MSEGEHVERRAISRSGAAGLRRHVHKGSWDPLGHGLGQLARGDVRYSRVAQVGYLGRHGCIQEDVSGREIPVDHGRTVIVQMCQSSGHVLKDGHLCGEGDVGCVLQKVVQASKQPFHHQHREARVGKETEAKELHNIGVPHGGEEAALVVVLGHYALGSLVPGVYVVEFLSRADQSVHLQLLHSPVGASAQLPTCRPHVGEDERLKLGSDLQRSTELLSTGKLLSSRHFDPIRLTQNRVVQ